ncbi:hypothetical protein PISMIDRAFT_684313 [Pisolithus microcarpus 441]|uniref:Uncharacterized protein n=1 Tax=Pisolithus microcarpus 441 TaxID=765257 RepID=A0A0C9Y0L1_9AGAM|nr:hypothetical protein PISMIDRAFT_684313 [Pisolithus microcarpus 441]
MIPSNRFLEIRPVPQTPPKVVHVLSRSSSQAVEPRELLLQSSGGRKPREGPAEKITESIGLSGYVGFALASLGGKVLRSRKFTSAMGPCRAGRGNAMEVFRGQSFTCLLECM